ncbi:MAG: ParB/RepB/Spo0J family partition protein [Nitrososphaerales archaeon]
MWNEFKLIPLDKIESNPYAARLDQNVGVDKLAESMSRHGQLADVLVRVHPASKDRFQLIYGHRRVAAARLLGWQNVRAKVVKASEEEMLIMALIENIERKDFTAYEKARIFLRLNKEFKRSYEEIARLIGRSKAYVAQHIAMLELFTKEQMKDPEVINLLQSLTERQARILLRIKDPNERLATAKIVVNENLCVKEVEKLVGRPRENANITKDRHKKKTMETISDVEKIKRKVLELFEWVEHKNLQPLITLRLEREFTAFDDFPPYTRLGYRDALVQNFHLIESWKGEFKLRCEGLKVRVFGETGLATFYIHYDVLYNGRPFRSTSRVTFVFLKRGDNWYIIHEHWSPLKVSELVEIGGKDDKG